MTLPRRATDPAPSGATRFDERLSVPWWWSLPALVVVGLVTFSVRLGHPGVPPWLCPLILIVGFVAAARRSGRIRVVVTEDDGENLLRVGSAALPTRFIAAVKAVSGDEKQTELGPSLDPSAYVLHRPWIGPLVRVDLADPDDPTPYWLFSVRRPDALLDALTARDPH